MQKKLKLKEYIQKKYGIRKKMDKLWKMILGLWKMLIFKCGNIVLSEIMGNIRGFGIIVIKLRENLEEKWVYQHFFE